jgi:hypothetical protein
VRTAPRRPPIAAERGSADHRFDDRRGDAKAPITHRRSPRGRGSADHRIGASAASSLQRKPKNDRIAITITTSPTM